MTRYVALDLKLQEEIMLTFLCFYLEMGMGKTIQTIVTILDNRSKLQHCTPGVKHPDAEKEVRQAEEERWSKHHEEWKHEMKMNNVPNSVLPKSTSKQAGGGFRAGTLVICPVIALSQWKSEIEKFTEAGTLKVGIYHGPNRASEMPREMMCKYDVVLTTYQVSCSHRTASGVPLTWTHHSLPVDPRTRFS